ncbi:MAG: prepilin-type N-terminal cleavage/methylation domain-containing protein [Candidatus Omnitrophica bacterium]|nr:prepilin-type N-terminal cleavage/methylation domain-containing protein [Candidatus Omnitrophota bacterium]
MKKAFTLVELMVATCILAIGLVGIARSLLSAVSALDYSNSIVQKVEFIDNVLSEVEKRSQAKDGFDSSDQDILGLLTEKQTQAKDEGIGDLNWNAQELEENITDFQISVSWEQGNNKKDASLGTYLLSKKASK